MAVPPTAGLSTAGAVNSAADLPGCLSREPSCNTQFKQGVVALVEGDENSPNLTIRFVTAEELEGEDGIQYSDGKNTVDFLGTGKDLVSSDGKTFSWGNNTTYARSFLVDFMPDGEDQLNGGLGIYGYQTDPGAVPTSGGANYSGSSYFDTQNSGEGWGEANFEVDFASGDVDLWIDVEGGTNDTILDIAIAGMDIDGNTLSGGTVTFYDDAGVFDFLGANSDTAAAGMFFGPVFRPDSTELAPNNIGSVMIGSGDDDAIGLVAYGTVQADDP